MVLFCNVTAGIGILEQASPMIQDFFRDGSGSSSVSAAAAAYRPALLTMVGVLAVGFVANLLVRPVSARFHQPSEPPPGHAEEMAGSAR